MYKPGGGWFRWLNIGGEAKAKVCNHHAVCYAAMENRNVKTCDLYPLLTDKEREWLSDCVVE
jgi:hypothetical protein